MSEDHAVCLGSTASRGDAPRKLGPMRFGVEKGGGPLPRDSLAFGDGLGWRWVGGRLGAVFFVFSGGCLGVVDFGRECDRSR